jgi:hypothetical protein
MTAAVAGEADSASTGTSGARTSAATALKLEGRVNPIQCPFCFCPYAETADDRDARLSGKTVVTFVNCGLTQSWPRVKERCLIREVICERHIRDHDPYSRSRDSFYQLKVRGSVRSLGRCENDRRAGTALTGNRCIYRRRSRRKVLPPPQFCPTPSSWPSGGG